MFRAKNYETASTFVKVMQRQLVASFFPDTVYIISQRNENTEQHADKQTDRQTDRQAGRRLVRSLTNSIRHLCFHVYMH